MSGSPSPDQKKLQDRLKKEAGISAVDLVRPGMVLGLGTGSTAKYALEEIARRLKDGRLSDIAGIPSSLETESPGAASAARAGPAPRERRTREAGTRAVGRTETSSRKTATSYQCRTAMFNMLNGPSYNCRPPASPNR